MRVLYCTDTYPPQVNGVSIVTAVSVGGLSRLGWACAVAAPRYPSAMQAASSPALAAAGDCEVHGFPSVAAPFYPEIRLARPASPSSAA